MSKRRSRTLRSRPLIAAVLLSCLLLPSAAAAEGFSFQARGGLFRPSEAAFREIYGGGLSWGAELGVEISPFLALWFGGDYFSSRGELIFTGEETRLRIAPLSAGLKLLFKMGRMRAYAGGGLGYFQFRETNSIATVEKGDLGFVGRAGFVVGLGAAFFADIQAAYLTCRVRPADIEAELGGFRFGVGLGFNF